MSKEIMIVATGDHHKALLGLPLYEEDLHELLDGSRVTIGLMQITTRDAIDEIREIFKGSNHSHIRDGLFQHMQLPSVDEAYLMTKLERVAGHLGTPLTTELVETLIGLSKAGFEFTLIYS